MTKIMAGEFMELGRALEIVLAMANVLYDNKDKLGVPAERVAYAVTAMDTVEDFICNHFEEDDDVDEVRKALPDFADALEHYGDVEGTEAQLNAVSEFLKLAFVVMPHASLVKFLEHSEVVEFLRDNKVSGDE